jgi:hypothetical protein
MQFGYFTLSDNHYADNRRSANQLIAHIRRATAAMRRRSASNPSGRPRCHHLCQTKS